MEPGTWTTEVFAMPCRHNIAIVRALLLAAAVGLPLRAFAQVDFSGEWAPRFHEDQPERVPGPELGDYLGLPISDAARLRADSWDASIQTLPEWQCRPHSADYIWRGPSQLTIRKEENPLTREITAFHAEWLRSIDNPVYLDGRPHPSSDALHSWGGFATGKWEGDMLTITVTHLKEGYIRRNGVPRSNLATVTEHWIRHGDFLTVVTIVNDPVYLTEPFIRTTDYELDLHQNVPPYPCEMVTEIERPKGVVPHHLPGTNTQVNEFAQRYDLPFEATRGGAATSYPDYRKKPASPSAASTPPAASARPASANASGEIRVTKVREHLYMLSGAGGNITALEFPEGVTLVDSGRAEMSDKVLAAVRTLSTKPIRYIINTHVHPDHVGGNEKIGATGHQITGGNVAGQLADAAEGAEIIAHENVLERMTAPSVKPAVPVAMTPGTTYHEDHLKLSTFYHGDGIELFYAPSAHTDGDTMVYFRRNDVLVTGDVFSTTSYPVVDVERGGSINGEIAALNRILELAFPDFRLEGGTLIIPGHGRLCDSADVAYYRDMVTIIRDRVQDMIKKGMTLEQVKAARPTRDYDGLYANTSGGSTPDMFVESVYKSLTLKKG
jgi:glyoxylase-like metal-dependent hydrolase (beta-lactamase superfamily II)